MRSIFFIGMFNLIASFLGAQNLVPNPSFEEYIECPSFLNQISRATGWSRVRGSPDFFNRCDTTDPTGIVSELLGVPANAVGWQEPATGDGYAGVVLYENSPFGGDSETREHLGISLAEPLQPGIPVYISMKVSPTTAGPIQDFRWITYGAGIRFTMQPYESNGLEPLPNQAAAYQIDAPMDTSAWYLISGVYVPDSAYEYVVLGNFFSDTLLTLEVLNPNSLDIDTVAYVYLDDICVSYELGYCETDIGWPELSDDMRVTAYPVPFTDHCTLTFNRDVSTAMTAELVDLSGRIAWRANVPQGQRTIGIEVPGLTGGVYVLRTFTATMAFKPLILVHVSP